MTTKQFRADLARGRAGEEFLQAKRELCLYWPPKGERRWDLTHIDPVFGKESKVEVKTDSYDPEQTPNFFMELLTTAPGGYEVVGGPWRALADKVHTFVYLYHKPGRSPSVAYWFRDLPALVHELDTRPSRWQMRSVKLDQLRATGLLVPRAALSGLYEEVRYEEER